MRCYRVNAVTIVTALSLSVLGLSVVGCAKEASPRPVLDSFLTGWSTGHLDNLGFVSVNGADVSAGDVARELRGVSGDLAGRPVMLTPMPPVVSEDAATATVKVAWTVAESVVWEYDTTVRLSRRHDTWRVVWTPSTVAPQLSTGDTLRLRRRLPERGEILDDTGAAIMTSRRVVTVGVQPSKVTDEHALIVGLATAFASAEADVDLADLPKRLASARPDAFVELVTLRQEVYDSVRDQIHDLPGTVFRAGVRQLAPTRTFARALLGTVGEVQREQMDAHPGRYQIGDQVGRSGLQEEYEDRLRGTDGVSVVVVADTASDGTTADEREVFRAEPRDGQDLRLTLNQRTQTTAEAALATAAQRSALVAVRISDGTIMAAANGPAGSGLNLAFTAQVPPGSTFKMVTALGLLSQGAVTADTIVDCPKTYQVSGRSFKNANNFALGQVAFHTDFAKSCNTAFASLAPKLGGDGLNQAAASVGIGVPWQLGTEAFTGSVATNVGPVEAAAAAFGQGQTLVSPVAMAGAVAAVARGRWQQPTLFDPVSGGSPVSELSVVPEPGQAASPAPTSAALPTSAATPTSHPLDQASVSALASMMREVVTVGTAKSLVDVPGGPVRAKTGTAEFDNNPEHTHAWVIGWQGDVAFAVFVENGGSSSATAVPIAERFLRGLAR